MFNKQFLPLIASNGTMYYIAYLLPDIEYFWKQREWKIVWSSSEAVSSHFLN